MKVPVWPAHVRILDCIKQTSSIIGLDLSLYMVLLRNYSQKYCKSHFLHLNPLLLFVSIVLQPSIIN